MKSIYDILAACGRPISKEDQVHSILAGLGPAFEPIVVVLTSQSDSYNVKAGSALLLASESKDLQQSILPDPSMATNIAMHTKSWHTNSGRSYSNKGSHGAYGQNNLESMQEKRPSF